MVSSSYDTNLKVEALLEHLRNKGISPTGRAKILRDHMAMCFVEIEGLDDPYGISQTPNRKFKRLFSRKVQEFHWNGINSDNDVSGTLCPYTMKLADIFNSCYETIFGEQAGGQTRAYVVSDLDYDHFSGSFEDREWIDIATGYRQTWEDLEKNQLDEDDLSDMLNDKRPFHRYEKNWKQPIDSIDNGYKNLVAAAREAKIPHLTVDVITGTDSKEIFNLAKALRRTSEAYCEIGCPSVGMDRIAIQVSPWSNGTSGTMKTTSGRVASPFTDNNPRIGISSRGAWELSEVIVHEILHAHDALLYVADVNKSECVALFSGELQKNVEYNTPLAIAWRGLAQSISHIEDNIDRSHMVMAMEALSDRWSVQGLDPDQMQQAISKWQENTDENRNTVLINEISNLLEGTPFHKSSSFRSRVVASEIQFLDEALKNLDEHTISKTPVFASFTEKFDNYLDDIEGVYRKGYFEDMAERVARAMQNVLDTTDDEQPENPYSKRWLVYAGTHLSGPIKNSFKAFFENPAVKQAYAKIDSMPGDLFSRATRTRLNANLEEWNTQVRVEATFKPLA